MGDISWLSFEHLEKCNFERGRGGPRGKKCNLGEGGVQVHARTNKIGRLGKGINMTLC